MSHTFKIVNFGKQNKNKSYQDASNNQRQGRAIEYLCHGDKFVLCVHFSVLKAIFIYFSFIQFNFYFPIQPHFVFIRYSFRFFSQTF